VETTSSALGEGHQDVTACKAIRLGMTIVAPSSRIRPLRFMSHKSRVTVSLEDPIIWAISWWVNSVGMRNSRLRASAETHESRRRESFCVELRARRSS